MPTYDYICNRCGHRMEVFHGVHDAGPSVCPDCRSEGTMRKALVAPAIHFKGTGWAKKDRAASATSGRTSTPASSAGPATAKNAPAAGTTGGDTGSGGSGSGPAGDAAG